MKIQWLNWRPAQTLWQAVEIALLSMVALALAHWAQPSDTLHLASGFPWVWLAPVLVALRYGMLSGLLSAALLLLGWLFFIEGNTLPGQVPAGTIIGGLILTMICGEFSTLWGNRQRRQTELNHYLDQRLEELTRQHYLLKLSHDRLEQNLISRPHTLRGALTELRDQLKQADDRDRLPESKVFMALLATHCQLSVAALFPAQGGRLQTTAVARVGEPADLDRDDPLVKFALDMHTLAHVNQEWVEGETTSRYLIAAPIFREGELAGLLAVEQMPFFAFNQDTLQTLTALISYYADTFTTGQTRAILATYPDCPMVFAQHLGLLANVQHASGAKSYLGVLRFPATERGAEIRHRLARGKRELDFYWLRDTPQMQLVALFPLTTEEGVQGYLARVDVWLETEYGQDHRSLGIRFSSTPLEPKRVQAQLEEYIAHAD
ncbi:MAG: PelD GGDEF domain-containing protein [Thiobacillus sp.]